MSKVLYEKDGRIGRITLNRPDVMNAIDDDLPVIGNATRQGDGRRQYSAQVAYTCPVGYGIGGSDRRVTVLTCTADGRWGGDTQPCLRKQTWISS